MTTRTPPSKMHRRLSSLRVALVALSARGALHQYVDALSGALADRIDLYVFAPEHYSRHARTAPHYSFTTGRSKWLAARRLFDPRAARDVWTQICSIEPHVIHVLSGEGYPWTLLWTRWTRTEQIPFVVTVHDPYPHPHDPLEWVADRVQRRVMRNATSVHVHSERFAHEAVRRSGSTVEVIAHGSLAPRFLRHARPAVTRESLALFFGRLRYYKGIDLLVEAAEYLPASLRIAIAGPGRLPWRLSAELRRRSDRFEIHNRFLDDKEVTELFQRASVCVLPYRQATQSSVPLIAAGLGVPVVSTALGGLAEDVPRVGGILVPPDNAKALAEGIVAAMGRTAVHPAELTFDAIAGRFISWYSSVVREPIGE
jgi:glycosyltransferase involved in cell wall biosynthesis